MHNSIPLNILINHEKLNIHFIFLTQLIRCICVHYNCLHVNVFKYMLKFDKGVDFYTKQCINSKDIL